MCADLSMRRHPGPAAITARCVGGTHEGSSLRGASSLFVSRLHGPVPARRRGRHKIVAVVSIKLELEDQIGTTYNGPSRARPERERRGSPRARSTDRGASRAASVRRITDRTSRCGAVRADRDPEIEVDRWKIVETSLNTRVRARSIDPKRTDSRRFGRDHEQRTRPRGRGQGARRSDCLSRHAIDTRLPADEGQKAHFFARLR